MVISESGYEAYQPVLSCASHFIFLYAIFILHFDTLSGEKQIFFSSQHMFPEFGGGGTGMQKQPNVMRRSDRKKKGGKGLEGPEVNWKVNVKQACCVPVFKVHPRKSGCYAGDNPEALIMQTLERKRRLCTYIEPADFKKRQRQRLGEL